ncbi:hypothetical protein ACQPWW_13195 [Micromonospora sp. CA-240977]|uniref:hypothetical protein n=1 Tax=Micromonospora sp. CA-240977 TaxID=3239957 RepID=UPI003D8C6A64
MRQMITARGWLHVIRLPAYVPGLNPTEQMWSHLNRSIGNRRDLLDGFLTHTGLTLDDST